MIADDDIGDGGNRQIGHQQKRIIQILLPPLLFHKRLRQPGTSSSWYSLGISWYLSRFLVLAFGPGRVRFPLARVWGARGHCFMHFHAGRWYVPLLVFFWCNITLLGVEAWRKGDDVLPQTSLFLPAAGGTGSWMDSAGRRACRRHRDEFKVPWKFESWMMQAGDSILTSCSVLASSSDLASVSPYLSPPRVSFSPSSCLVPYRAGHRESGAMLKSSVILTLPALHRTQYKTEILPPGPVRLPRYPRLCVYCIRRLKLELHAPKVVDPIVCTV